MSFRENLRDEISYQGLRIKEVAGKAQISESSFLSYVDARAALPNVEVAVKIAQALNVSVEYLVTGSDRSTPIDLKPFMIYKDLLKEISKLSPESWNELKPFILGDIQIKQQQEQEKNQKATTIS